MKNKKLFFIPIIALIFTSCSSIRVSSDYDSKTDFNQYKTFAFYKTGIDKVEISDLDKRRIMHAIEVELLAKGMVKSSNPDLLVNLFTKSRQRVNVNQYNHFGYGYGYGFGWNPWMRNGGLNGNVNITRYTEGTLFVDLIDASKKQLVWQGIGTGALQANSVAKKEAKIKEFVAEIMEKYPPEVSSK